MGSEWREVRLGDLAEIYDGPHATPHTVDEGPMFLGIACLDGGRLDLAKAEHLTETDFARWTRRVTPKPGDVVFSYETRIGEAARIPPGFRGCLGRRMGLLRPKPNVDPSFLLYAYLSPEFQETLRSRTIHGSTVDRIPLVQLGDFPIRVPPLSQQQVIGSVLAALDDKVDLNRRMSQTLESISCALFKSWFVDFDPSRAKSEGRDPGLPAALADLFPSGFDDSELGDIPKGWQVGPLDSVLVLQRGFDLPSPDRTPGAYPVLAASGPSGMHDTFMVRGPGVTTGRSGVLGKVFYVEEDFWPLNTSLWVKEYRRSLPAYAYHLMRGIPFELFNAGSAVPTLNRNHVHSLPTLLPPMALVAAFDRLATISLRRQRECDDQSRALAAVRDSLLSRLIAGELRLSPMRDGGLVA